MTTESKIEELRKLLETSSGRAKMAAAIGPELRRRRDYVTIARMAFGEDEPSLVDQPAELPEVVPEPEPKFELPRFNLSPY